MELVNKERVIAYIDGFNLFFGLVVLKILYLCQMTKEITPLQYSKYLGCSLSNVTKHIRKGSLHCLPDVIEVKHYSRFYLLVVAANLPVKP